MDTIEKIESKITERVEHAWTTDFTLQSPDCGAFSPEVLCHSIFGSFGFEDFVIVSKADFEKLTNGKG